MDGLSFLRKIMALHPMPVVMVSTLTQAGADVTLQALEAGAVDFVAKPTTTRQEHGPARPGIAAKVKNAARTRVGRAPRSRAGSRPAVPVQSIGPTDKIFRRRFDRRRRGAESVLMGFPADCPPILITQHMPERFTAAFAAASQPRMPDGGRRKPRTIEPMQQGHVYIAPGSHHLEIVRKRQSLRLPAASTDAPVSGHRPSVDVLFGSAARVVGRTAVGAILTGMGKDGAKVCSKCARPARDARPGRSVIADLRHAARGVRDAAP